MNIWTSIKVTGATCLIALGQLQAGQIERSEAEVSLTPATIFAAAPTGLAMPVLLSSLDDHADNRVARSSVSESFDHSILALEEYTEKSVSTGAVFARVDAPEVNRNLELTLASRTPKLITATVVAPAPGRKLATRPAMTPGFLFFPMIFKSIVLATLVMGLKQMITTFNLSTRLEQHL